MVLDPMTGEEQEPQDLRIVIAHKVRKQLSFRQQQNNLRCLPCYASSSNHHTVLQRFLYTSQSLPDKDKGKLQKEILDTIFAEGKLASLIGNM